jgi:hypothetical protein
MSVFRQNILRHASPNITFHRAVPHNSYLDSLLDRLGDSTIGVSYSLCSSGSVISIALATTTDVVLIHVTPTSRPQSRLARLLGGEVTITSFNMAKTALYVLRDLQYHVEGIDLSTALSKSTAAPMTAAQVVKEMLLQDNVDRVKALWMEDKDENVRLRAWVAAWSDVQ